MSSSSPSLSGAFLKALTFALINLTLLIHRASSQCDQNTGCYPDKLNILDGIANFPARSIVVSSTCGDSPQATNNIYENIIISNDQQTLTCDQSVVSPDKMVDTETRGGTPTYWQSDLMIQPGNSSVTPQSVIFEFTDEFLFYELIVKFAVPHDATPDNSADARPESWIVEKRNSQGEWVPLQYFAKDCNEAFPGIPLASGSVTTIQAECVQYPPQENGFFDDYNWGEYFPGNMDVNLHQYKNDTGVASHFTTSAIRLNFLQPAVSLRPLASYVAISYVRMDVVCKCNGHASTCAGLNGATCDCQHSTAGQQCDQCRPLYNNRLPMAGTTTYAGECQVCSCNQHASSCQFDALKDYGVCEACLNNTAGDFCSECAVGYFVNVTWQNAGDYCLSCGCTASGTLQSRLITCNGTDGQCGCKTHVMRRDCSECKDGFYGLSADKADGCTACACNRDGTVGDSNLCNKDDGACLCRANVGGTTCDACKPLTYNFDSTNPDGCSQCNCDVGASSDLACNLVSGQCPCLSNIVGRDCRTPVSGSFVPKMDFLRIEPEMSAADENVVLRAGHGSPNAQVSGRGLLSLTAATNFQTTFTPRFGGQMDMVIQFEKSASTSFILVQGTITLTGSGYDCNGQTITDNQSWDIASPVTDDRERGSAILTQICLNSGSTYTISLRNTGSQYLIDSILFIPVVTSVIESLGNKIDSQEVARCRDEAMSVYPQDRSSCDGIEYSVMASLLNGAIACSCSTGGVIDTQCDPMTGDCNCRNGALPPDCSVCKTDFYNYNINTGCIGCDCNINGSLNQYCSETGICQCQTNVQGDKCDSCLTDFYGLYTGAGCQECQCDSTYSLDNDCADSGQCNCKPGVGGLTCQACDDGFYNLTPDGCTACQCEAKGSTEASCNPVTGECECLANVEGHTCSQCKDGFHGLGSWHPGGCIPCFCWGKGISCTSLKNYADSSIISGTRNANFDGWTAEMEDGTDVPVSQSSSFSNGLVSFRLALTSLPDFTQSIFYTSPSKFHGDRSSAYGRSLKFSVTLTSSPLTSMVPVRVMLHGLYFSSPLVSTVELDTSLSSQFFDIPIREGSWLSIINTDTTEEVTFSNFMSVLTEISSIKVQAINSQFTGVMYNLDSVVLDNAVELAGGDINNKEQCQCQLGYDGNHCEKCSDGYTRPNVNSTHPSDQCVACQCNGHSQGPCDPVSGVCTCTHNTEGDDCDLCVSGYYGDATKGTPDDCLPCACPGNVPRADLNVFALTCALNDVNYPVCVSCEEGHGGDHCQLCLDGYFGTPENASNAEGKCQPCICNGRADTCDTRTGECISCRENTTGHTCEICASGFYGDAMAEACKECVCKSLEGSTGECDPSTGICECLPNVEGFQCDVCKDTTFNLTKGVGCHSCDCDGTGSEEDVCNKESGQCPCLPLVQGRQCNECQASYWNINQENGCDACGCNVTGTAKQGDVTIESCDLVTGQCQCALPGITGRKCDACSPVTTFQFQYIQLFFLGVFPQCELCGECFDSWGGIIDSVGIEINDLYAKSALTWSKYDNQTAETIGASLNTTEQNIRSTNESLVRFGQIAVDLQFLAGNYSQAIAQNDRIEAKTQLLLGTKTSLETTFAPVESLTSTIQLTALTITTLSAILAEMGRLTTETRDSVQRGNASWERIESLAFVVAPPEERERQLLQQAEKSMSLASLANSTLLLANVLVETSLSPAVTNSERELSDATDKEGEAMRTLAQIHAIHEEVTNNISAIESALVSLATDSETARANMLQAVEDLQEHMVNASRNQIDLNKVESRTMEFLTLASQAEQSATVAMVTVLENMAALTQAQNDMIRAQASSNNVLNKQLRSASDLQAILDTIDQSSVSAADVDALNLKAQKALFDADEALSETQQALGLAREVKQEVELMENDIQEAKNLQVQAQGIRSAAIAESGSIQDVIDKANGHITKTQQDISQLTSMTQDTQDDVKTVTSCLTQAIVSVGSTTDASNEAGTRSQSATTAQQTLLGVMLDINSETSDQSSSQDLTTMTTAKTTMDQILVDTQDVMNITDVEVLLQDLVNQTTQITTLESSIDQLMSQVSLLIVALEESVGDNSCSNP